MKEGQSEDRGHRSTHPRPFNEATGRTIRGTPTHERGGLTLQTGTPTTQPPFNVMPPRHHATPHPPPRNAPPSTTTRGGDRRIPHHTKTTDRHSPTHHSTWQQDSNTTRPHYSWHALDKAWHWPRHTTGPGRTTAHSTAIQHTTHHEDGHHPLTLSHCSRSYNQRSTMINDEHD